MSYLTGLGLIMTTEIFEKVLFSYHFMKEPQLDGILYDVTKTEGCIAVEVYRLDESSNKVKLFKFKDYISVCGKWITRLTSDVELIFEVYEDYNIKCVDCSRFVRGCHQLVKVEKDEELKVKSFATIDIETCWYEDENIKIYIPYAIGIYNMGKYKSFYVTNYSSKSGSIYDNAINMVEDLYKK